MPISDCNSEYEYTLTDITDSNIAV